jgi:hypothetical protein
MQVISPGRTAITAGGKLDGSGIRTWLGASTPRLS